MPDNENGQIPVEETTTPMPSETKPEDENSLPDEAAERTKEQFAKLTEKNKELAQKLELLEKVNAPPEVPKPSALERLKGPSQQIEPPTPPVEEPEVSEEFVDKDGYLDEARLKKGFEDSRRKAKDAEEKARLAQQKADEAVRRIEEYEITNEKKRVHADFPEIDPYSEKFNPKLYDQVSKDMLWNLVNVGKEDFYGTTAKVVGEYRQGTTGAEQQQQRQAEQVEKSKQEIQEPNRSGSASLTRKEELMREIQKPKQAGLDALTELMREY
jgi:hypothetical protein